MFLQGDMEWDLFYQRQLTHYRQNSFGCSMYGVIYKFLNQYFYHLADMCALLLDTKQSHETFGVTKSDALVCKTKLTRFLLKFNNVCCGEGRNN